MLLTAADCSSGCTHDGDNDDQWRTFPFQPCSEKSAVTRYLGVFCQFVNRAEFPAPSFPLRSF